jgi:DNA-binding CsgD family transcriptional regulator
MDEGAAALSPRSVKPPLGPPAGLVATRFELAGDAFALLEWPVAVRAAIASLSPAECEVLELLLEGLSNAQIARRRGRSPRTIANRVASMFRRLGVRSRLELFAALSAGGARGRRASKAEGRVELRKARPPARCRDRALSRCAASGPSRSAPASPAQP